MRRIAVGGLLLLGLGALPALLHAGFSGATAPGGVPVGAILLVVAGGCPAGFAEETSLSGRALVGTTAGPGDVGTGGTWSMPSGGPPGTLVTFTRVIFCRKT